MQLEVGKTYVDRTGYLHKIVSRDNYSDFPYTDEENNNYTRFGNFFYSLVDDLDLIEEYQPSVQPTKALPLEQVREMCSEANRGYCIEFEHYLKAVRDTERKHGIME